MNQFETLSEAYLHALKQVLENPDHRIETVQTGDKRYDYNRQACIEKLNYQFTVRSPSLDYIQTYSQERNLVIREYFDKEYELCQSGNISDMGKISKVWDLIANPDGTVNANYGYMVFHLKDAGNLKFDPNLKSQWDFAKSRLLLCKESNQAYLHFNRPKDQYDSNLDQPCTMFIQFYIRDDRLNLNAFMRSNDLVYGTPYNTMYFMRLLFQMREELLVEYPKLEIGQYTHFATSLHIYERHIPKVREMLGLSEHILKN